MVCTLLTTNYKVPMLHIKNVHAELICNGLQQYHSLLPKPNSVPIRPVWRLTEIVLRRNLGIAGGMRYNMLGTLCAVINTEGATMERQLLLGLIITLPLIVFWLWMAWDLGGNDDMSGSEKFYWQLAFIFLNVFAAVYYYVYVFRKRH